MSYANLICTPNNDNIGVQIAKKASFLDYSMH